jgi:hypothetical protein
MAQKSIMVFWDTGEAATAKDLDPDLGVVACQGCKFDVSDLVLFRGFTPSPEERFTERWFCSFCADAAGISRIYRDFLDDGKESPWWWIRNEQRRIKVACCLNNRLLKDFRNSPR